MCRIILAVPFVPRLLEQCHDVEMNPGPRPAAGGSRPVRNGKAVNGVQQSNSTAAVPAVPAEDLRVEKLGLSACCYVEVAIALSM
jgi:hypothetical protein